MQGNIAGWLGLRFDATETDRWDITVRETRDSLNADWVVRGLAPYETVLVVAEAGDGLEERRVVANDCGIIYLRVDANVVKSDHDPHLSVNVGTERDPPGRIEIDAEWVEVFTDD